MAGLGSVLLNPVNIRCTSAHHPPALASSFRHCRALKTCAVLFFGCTLSLNVVAFQRRRTDKIQVDFVLRHRCQPRSEARPWNTHHGHRGHRHSVGCMYFYVGGVGDLHCDILMSDDAKSIYSFRLAVSGNCFQGHYFTNSVVSCRIVNWMRKSANYLLLFIKQNCIKFQPTITLNPNHRLLWGNWEQKSDPAQRKESFESLKLNNRCRSFHLCHVRLISHYRPTCI